MLFYHKNASATDFESKNNTFQNPVGAFAPKIYSSSKSTELPALLHDNILHFRYLMIFK